MRERLIQTAAGNRQADLVLKNAKILNVFTGGFIEGNIAVTDGRIAGVGDYSRGRQVVDLEGRHVVPGFINAHCHVESSMVLPDVYCMEEVRHGTTTLITDPHEVANVAGTEGVLFMLDAAKGMPVNYFVQVPTCVPATSFENSGARLEAAMMAELLEKPGALGLGEMMNYPGVISCESDVLEKLALADGRVVDGHSPALTGKELQAYAAAGISTDHECTSYEEAYEKLSAGFAVLIREGSACKDLEAIVSGIVREGINTERVAFCTDDKHIAHIRREGTIRNCIRKAIALGLPPYEAYAMASYNAAKIYRLYDLGAIAPGYRADFVIIGSLNDVEVEAVYKDGAVVKKEGIERAKRPDTPLKSSVNIARLSDNCFNLPKKASYPVIKMLKDQIVTEKVNLTYDEVISGLESFRLCKIAVIERHHATGNVGLGLIMDYGLKGGAVATTVAHDSHNIMVVGTNDGDMRLAVEEIERLKGGYVLAREGEITGSLPLPVYGLMSCRETEDFIESLDIIISQARDAGIRKDIEPFTTLSFMALPVIPEIRVTDLGVFDVKEFRFI